jgi:DNA polymerase III alpha subunit
VEDLDVDDKSLYLPLSSDFKNPHGIFQLEADTNFKVCRKIKPNSLEELSAVIAIARPGALDFADDYASYVRTKEVVDIHPIFSDILSYTGGIPLYQEQLMKMAVQIGFNLDEAEQLRRIVGKKKIDLMPEWKSKIETKVDENNLPKEVGEILWRVAEDSANYSFNKSHSISYATLSAWTVYLKFNYPQDFFLSLLRLTKFEPSPQEEISSISKDLPYFGMSLLPPDLTKSSMDFSKEGGDIRFGLNSIKGVSEKSLSSLSKFRKSEAPTKFSVFISAKQAGLNIGILSSLIQAGCLSNSESSRPLLVLEAQSFNLLTDREKRNALLLGEDYNYKLLDIMLAAKDGLVADDGKLFMKESRFNTFKKKYDKYKEIYIQNKKFEKFANWYFETKLLGYSYSSELKSVFQNSELILNSIDYFNMEERGRGKFICVVDDVFKGSTRSGGGYVKLFVSDEKGKYSTMLCDNRRSSKYTEYVESGKSLPQKDDIISVYGSKGTDILFAETISVLNEKIYMKLGDLK